MVALSHPTLYSALKYFEEPVRILLAQQTTQSSSRFLIFIFLFPQLYKSRGCSEFLVLLQRSMIWASNSLKVTNSKVFRLKEHVLMLTCALAVGAMPDLDSMDCHVVSGCLKKFLRELPEPLFTFHAHDQFLAAASMFVFVF